MEAEIVSVDFVNSKPINLDDKVNLRDIYQTLAEKGGIATSIDFNKWAHRKLQYYTENIDYFSFDKNVEREIGASYRKEISTTVQVAMEIIANGHKEAGHEMRRFLTECIKLSMKERNGSSLIDSDLLLDLEKELKGHSVPVESISELLSCYNAKKTAEKNLKLVLASLPLSPVLDGYIKPRLSKGSSGSGKPMTIGAISRMYFEGLPEFVVGAFLRESNQPKASDGPKARYLDLDLGEAASVFFDDVTYLKEHKGRHYYFSSWIGNFSAPIRVSRTCDRDPVWASEQKR
ncbi:hypothetical protein [Pseudobacteriovorax antillogorgiicola]|uniref:Uncharacterized protein n=1 Tax=Pseudobacteriovorax antillogorgiicola TaxID=1513793 RepID=A0A1Y6CVQ0_9BACT|nr:hypothetical protein [Pseudobacteriovorax antillogorgiicola]TCS44230.1 hypothetical protein EDD56_13430 [Pseudobacteriovorax antillogorgiicola]SMF80631.1 hypothetical protein SAMN06296036_13531 [Pseudobacteriovorax antillogorgiicola]